MTHRHLFRPLLAALVATGAILASIPDLAAGPPAIAENFDRAGWTAGSLLSGYPGWTIHEGTAVVTTEKSHSRPHGVKVSAATMVAEVEREVRVTAITLAFTDLWILPVADTSMPPGNQIDIDGAALSFLVDPGTGKGRWEVYDSSTGESIPAGGLYDLEPATNRSANWIRLTVRQEFDQGAADTYDLYLDGELVAFDIPFSENPANGYLESYVVWGDTQDDLYFDDFVVSTSNPLFADADRDGMRDSWEDGHGLDSSADDRDADPDGDGLTNVEESMHRSDPDAVDSDGDGVDDGWEVDNGLDPADPADGTADPDADGFTNAEEFAATPKTDPNDSTDAPPGNVFFVATNGDDANPGTSSLPVKTIQAGIDLAAAGDRVVIKDGIYSGSGNTGLNFWGKALLLRGINGSSNVTIDCAGYDRAFEFSYGEPAGTTVEGITVNYGYHNNGGAVAVLNTNSAPTFRSCVFENCTAGYGGAIYVGAGSCTLENCTVSGNYSSYNGGAVWVFGGSTLTARETTFVGNHSYASGGGVWIQYYCNLNLEDCVFLGNTADSDGGATLVDNSYATIENTLFDSNESYSGSGGGMAAYGISPVLSRSTFKGNKANGDGGGLFLYYANPLVDNCAFVGNGLTGYYNGLAAAGYGSGTLRFRNCTFSGHADTMGTGASVIFTDASGTAEVHNSILWNRGASEIGGYYSPAVTFSAVDTGPGNPPFYGAGNVNVNPRLRSDGIHLEPYSPLIGAGDDADAPPDDFEGEPRGASVDIGADQYTDADGDGLPDWFERQLAAAYPADAIRSIADVHPTTDTDRDGAVDGDEFAKGTDPAGGPSDGDGDGVSDDQEEAQGSDPDDGNDFSPPDDISELLSVRLGIGNRSGTNVLEIDVFDMEDDGTEGVLFLTHKANPDGSYNEATYDGFRVGRGYVFKMAGDTSVSGSGRSYDLVVDPLPPPLADPASPPSPPRAVVVDGTSGAQPAVPPMLGEHSEGGLGSTEMDFRLGATNGRVVFFTKILLNDGDKNAPPPVAAFGEAKTAEDGETLEMAVIDDDSPLSGKAQFTINFPQPEFTEGSLQWKVIGAGADETSGWDSDTGANGNHVVTVDPRLNEDERWEIQILDRDGNLLTKAFAVIGCSACAGGDGATCPAGDTEVSTGPDGLEGSAGVGSGRSPASTKGGPNTCSGRLSFSFKRPDASAFDPDSLQYSGCAEIERLEDPATQKLRQVRSGSALVDIVVLTAESYEMRFYEDADVGVKQGGLYDIAGATPFKTVKVENPDEVTGLHERARITVGDQVFHYRFHGGTYIGTGGSGSGHGSSWGLTKEVDNPVGPALDPAREEISVRWYGGNFLKEVTRTLYDTPAGGSERVISVVEETYAAYHWGETLIKEVIDPEGAALTTEHTYHLAPVAGKHSNLLSTTGPDGHWVYFDYDGQGRRTKVVRQHRDNGVTLDPVSGLPDAATEAANRVTVTEYDASNYDRVTFETVEGVEVSRVYFAAADTDADGTFDRFEEQVAVDPEELFEEFYPGSSTNLRILTRYYPPVGGSPASNRVKSVERADGTFETYAYAKPQPGEFQTIHEVGYAPDPPTAVTEGTRTETITNAQGHVIERNISAFGPGSDVEVHWEKVFLVDGSGRPLVIDYPEDESKVTRVYDCCYLTSETGRDGRTTEYKYDGHGRRVHTFWPDTGIAESLTLDGLGRVRKRVRTGNAVWDAMTQSYTGDQITLEENDFDLAGRLAETRDALGWATTFAETIDSTSGHTTRTTTFPYTGLPATGPAVEEEVTYPDGSLLEVRRSVGVITPDPVLVAKYDYGNSASGESRWTQEIRVGTSGELTEWTKTYSRMGRYTKTEFPDGASATRTYEERKNRPEFDIDADGVTTLFGYNLRGERDTVATDMDGDSDLVLASTDRVTRTTVDYGAKGLPSNDVFVRRTTVEVWPDNGADSPEEVSVFEEAVSLVGADGNIHQTWNTSGGRTVHTETVYPETADGSWTVTTKTFNESDLATPVGAITVQEFEDGRLKAEIVQDSGGVEVSRIDFLYDAHGRVWKSTDSRTGQTTYTYTNRDQVDTVTDPGSRVTDTDYDALGRPVEVTLPDNTITYTGYDYAGNLTQTSGSQSYKVGYEYDRQGRRTSMEVKNGPSPGTFRTTTWVYSGTRGWLDKKVHADLKETNYTYTPAGRLLTRTWARGLVTTYGYNAAGDLETTDYSDATPDVLRTYTRLGQLKLVKDGTLSGGTIASPRYTHSYVYDAAFPLRLKTEYVTGVHPSIKGLNRLYEPGTSPGELTGRPAGYQVGTVLNPDADAETTYTFDGAGRLETVADQDASSFTYAYTPDSYHLPASLTGGPIKVTYTWEADRDVLASVQNDQNPPAAEPISNYAYAVNSIGQRESVTRTGTAFPGGSHSLYLYNSAGEMTDSETYGGTVVPSPVPDPLPAGGLPAYHRKYLFDDIGNRLSAEEGTAAAVPYSPGVTNNYLTVGPDTLVYDDDGNLLDDGTYAFTWDGENRLTAVFPLDTDPDDGTLRHVATFDYLGRRVTKVSEVYNNSVWNDHRDERLLYDGWNLATIHWGEAGGAVSNLKTYTWGRDLSGSIQGAGGVGGLLAAHENGGIWNGNHFAYLHDGNGNVTQVIDPNGGTAARYDYGPFGQLVDLAPLGPVSYSYALENPFRFSTKFADETHAPDPASYDDAYRDIFYYYGFRSYDPQAGRWLNRDPIGEAGGLNTYGFLGNQAISRIDHLGLCDLHGIALRALKGAARELLTDIAIRLGKKAAAKSVIAAYDGLLPIGDLISILGGGYHVGQFAGEFRRIRGIYKDTFRMMRIQFAEGSLRQAIKGCKEKCCDQFEQALSVMLGGVFTRKGRNNLGIKQLRTQLDELKSCCCLNKKKHPHNIQTKNADSPEAAEDIREYGRRTNQVLDQTGPQVIQNTKGPVRRDASADARRERRRAARAGTPYEGQAGHVPDTAITGQTSPPGGYLDMRGNSNSIAGGSLGSRVGETVDHITVDGVIP